MSLLEDYLNNVVSGALNPKGNLGDFSHASRLFTHSAFRLSPKTKFLYHCVFELSSDALEFVSTFNSNPVLQTEFNLLVKQADLPKMNMQVNTKNQYNRKKNVQTAIEYDPVNITFHDDSLGITTALLEGYYRYFFKDGNYYVDGVSPPYDPRNLYKNTEFHKYRFGFDNDSIGPFFNKITIYQLSRHQYTGFTLVNPMITSIQHDTMDYYDASTPVQNQISVAYEGIFYSRGAVDIGSPKTFAETHYDKQASFLTPLGGGTSTLFGAGGVLDSLEDIFSDIATGNVGLDTIFAAINAYRNAKDLNSETLRSEGLSLASGIAGAAIGAAVGGIANAVFPKNTGTGGSSAASSQSGTNTATGGAVDTSSAVYNNKVNNGQTTGNTGGGGGG